MKLQDRFHVTYCTNIHPGQDWESTWTSLREYLPLVKANVSPDALFGVGLRLSNKASEELAVGSRLREFKSWLDQQGLYVFTMNGFPYGNFHNERVKEQVHAPDWTTNERLGYTKRLFDQLAFLLPDGLAGGISTSPISYKHWYDTPEKKLQALETASGQLTTLVLHLHGIEEATGKYLHLDIEPEPDGMLENSTEVVAFFNKHLEPAALPVLREKLGISTEEALKLLRKYITVCYDICHFSLAYEPPELSFGRFRDAGIAIGKIQVSAALKICFEEGTEDKVWDALSLFDEPTYLHQVTENRDGIVHTYPDLAVVLASRKKSRELRAHFHVPIFLKGFGHLFSTQDQILAVLEYLKKETVTAQLEVETYTWEVLPESLKKKLADSIIRELNWLKENLEA